MGIRYLLLLALIVALWVSGTGLTRGSEVFSSGVDEQFNKKLGPGSTGNTLPKEAVMRYLTRLKNKVESVWRYPDRIDGEHRVVVGFKVDRSGNLLEPFVKESTDSRISSSAIDAMKRASPFEPIPDSLSELVNEPLIIMFRVRSRYR